MAPIRSDSREATYPSGVGRRGWRSRLRSALPAWLDQLDEAVDAEVGEGHGEILNR